MGRNQSDAPGNQVPDSSLSILRRSSYLLIACVAYTFFKVGEYATAEYAAYHGITADEQEEEKATAYIRW